MPNYHYRGTCGHEFEIFQSIKDVPLKQCPECDGEIYRVIYAPTLCLKTDPKTVGHISWRNTCEMSRMELDDKRASDISAQRFKKPEYAPPPWRPNKPKIDKDLATLTPAQTEKYVATGKKP